VRDLCLIIHKSRGVVDVASRSLSVEMMLNRDGGVDRCRRRRRKG
jgi:hypothetical protein